MKITFPNVNLNYSLHNHSNFSDGANSIEEMCQGAKAAGIKVFGLSDHWLIPPTDKIDASSWAMNPNNLELYIQTRVFFPRLGVPEAISTEESL